MDKIKAEVLVWGKPSYNQYQPKMNSFEQPLLTGTTKFIMHDTEL